MTVRTTTHVTFRLPDEEFAIKLFFASHDRKEWVCTGVAHDIVGYTKEVVENVDPCGKGNATEVADGDCDDQAHV